MATSTATVIQSGNRPPLPTDVDQMIRVTKYELLNFVRSRRFVVLLIITVIIVGALTGVTAYYRPAALIVSGLAFYGTWWSPIGALVALSVALFAGDAIAGEFQSKTGYFLFDHPVRRSSVFLGKMIAAFLASALIITIYAVITVGNGWYYTGTPPIRRSAVSRHAIRVGRVRSHTGSTTRNRDQASHMQNSSVSRSFPSGPQGTRGPFPQSHCSQSPGSDLLTELTMSR